MDKVAEAPRPRARAAVAIWCWGKSRKQARSRDISDIGDQQQLKTALLHSFDRSHMAAAEARPALAHVVAWDPAAVASWVATLDIVGKETIAQSVVDQECDGDTLMSFKDKLEVKTGLELPMGKANKLWQAIRLIKKSRAPPEKALLFRPLIQRYPVPQLRRVFRHF